MIPERELRDAKVVGLGSSSFFFFPFFFSFFFFFFEKIVHLDGHVKPLAYYFFFFGYYLWFSYDYFQMVFFLLSIKKYMVSFHKLKTIKSNFMRKTNP